MGEKKIEQFLKTVLSGRLNRTLSSFFGSGGYVFPVMVMWTYVDANRR